MTDQEKAREIALAREAQYYASNSARRMAGYREGWAEGMREAAEIARGRQRRMEEAVSKMPPGTRAGSYFADCNASRAIADAIEAKAQGEG